MIHYEFCPTRAAVSGFVAQGIRPILVIVGPTAEAAIAQRLVEADRRFIVDPDLERQRCSAAPQRFGLGRRDETSGEAEPRACRSTASE